jgi:hypothetical protein
MVHPLKRPGKGPFDKLKANGERDQTMTVQQSKTLFYSAALFNWAAVLILALLAQQLGLQPPQQTLFGQLVLLAIFAFGYGYWIVGRKPETNRGLVVLGAFSKLGVVAIVMWNWLSGLATPQMAALVSGDVVYALLFVLFLKQDRAVAA